MLSTMLTNGDRNVKSEVGQLLSFMLGLDDGSFKTRIGALSAARPDPQDAGYRGWKAEATALADVITDRVVKVTAANAHVKSKRKNYMSSTTAVTKATPKSARRLKTWARPKNYPKTPSRTSSNTSNESDQV
jgi:hypothetical protein